MKEQIKVIAFDADDTLWVNEPYFQETEQAFCGLLEAYMSHHALSQALFKVEMSNLHLYGYGIKGFVLCMLETAMTVTEGKINPEILAKIIDLGKDMLEKPVELLPNVRDVLAQLSKKYRLVVATKGDLLDQERKLDKSGLTPFFHHIEIMSDKQEKDYAKLIKHLDIAPDAFLMLGNSLKSDVLPVLNLGAWACHIPFHTTWQHEQAAPIEVPNPKFKHLDNIADVLKMLD